MLEQTIDKKEKGMHNLTTTLFFSILYIKYLRGEERLMVTLTEKKTLKTFVIFNNPLTLVCEQKYCLPL